MKKLPLIIITGPTAVGKTDLSVRLARQIGGEIISADSMQVYRHMDIGSAKVTEAERQGIPHHLIDILEPDEEFNVVMFQRLAQEKMREIYERGAVPVIAGGTGFYIQALLYGIDFTETTELPEFRNELERKAASEGPGALHSMLQRVDPESAESIHENNVKRVIRALEFYHQTGMRISEHNKKERERESPYQFFYYVLNMERPVLYERIDLRVDQMMEQGLVEEVQHLKEMGCTRQMVSMQGLGYKEILDYLDGIVTLEQAVYTIKRDTRHFAKRQLTWFKRERDVRWLNLPDFNADRTRILSHIMEEFYRETGSGGEKD